MTLKYSCPYCGSSDINIIGDIIICMHCHQSSKLVKPDNQLTLDFLKGSFQVEEPPSKTLKTKVRQGEDLTCAVAKAYRYVQDNKEGYNRVEFKYGPCYIVVAKLRDKE